MNNAPESYVGEGDSISRRSGPVRSAASWRRLIGEAAFWFSANARGRTPKLGPERRNEAKRYKAPIDALYEAKATIAASADAEPAELYVAGDGSFEFARTASRLIEMRSREYLAAGRG